MLAKSEYEDALRLAKNLLKNINKKSTWSEEDEQKLAKLTKIVNILSKLKPLEKRGNKEVAVITSAQDEEIIKRFLARKKV